AVPVALVLVRGAGGGFGGVIRPGAGDGRRSGALDASELIDASRWRWLASSASWLPGRHARGAGRGAWLQTCGVGAAAARGVGRGAGDQAVMRPAEGGLRVLWSSPRGERAGGGWAVSRGVSALRLTPVMFELGARPYPPREVYQQYLAQSDVFIGLYWQRYG